MSTQRPEMWAMMDVAKCMSVPEETVRSWLRRGDMPTPDDASGDDPLWRAQTILEWQSSRGHRSVPGEEDPTDLGGCAGVAAETAGQTESSSTGGVVGGVTADGAASSTGPADASGLGRHLVDSIVAANLDDHAGGAARSGRRRSEWLVGPERLLYDNEWVRLSLVEVDPPEGEPYDHHVVATHEAAICLVLDEARERVAMAWRHRFAPDVWNWELPGGLVDEGEEPAATAIREVAEELSITVGEAEHLVSYEPNIGIMRATHHVYRAVATSTVPAGESDPNEVGRLEWVPLTEVPKLIADGKIVSSGGLVALLYHLGIPSLE